MKPHGAIPLGPLLFVASVLYASTMTAIHAHHVRATNQHIAELEHDKEVLARLCGAVMCVPCSKGESGAQCQARMGARYEVIYYPDADAYVAELKAEVTP